MKIKETTTVLYQSEDGKQFLTKEECELHEKELEYIKGIKYFLVSHDIDKTETGAYFNKTLVAVGSNRYYISQEDIFLNWCIKTFGAFIECGVQGYGIMNTFSYIKVSKETYDECKPYCVYGGWGTHTPKKVFISDKKINGFPEPYDIKKEWNIK